MYRDIAEKKLNQTVLLETHWKASKATHEAVLSEILDPYLKKRSQHKKDPVLDFLFEYYKFRPSHLAKWSPGLEVHLEFKHKTDLPEISEICTVGSHAYINPDFFPQKRLRSVEWMLGLLKKSCNQRPMFGCFGMHEWAMVYKAGDIRHEQIPLRLPPSEIASFVESRPLVCTHFDAFRFFTEKARPLNKHALSRETFQDTEQPGCIHTNMDLYKWAYKLFPWISSDVIREAFLNAVEARKTDMQASPYDVTEFGLEPIPIETEAGRKVYISKQVQIFEQSMPIRENLIEEYEKLLTSVSA